MLNNFNILPLQFTQGQEECVFYLRFFLNSLFCCVDEACVGKPTVLVGHDKGEDDSLVPCWLNGSITGLDDGHMVVSTLGDQSVMGMCVSHFLLVVPIVFSLSH